MKALGDESERRAAPRGQDPHEARPLRGRGRRTDRRQAGARFAHAASSLQDVLGDLNDSVVAARWLDDWAARGDDAEAARGAASLAALERSAAPNSERLWRAAGTSSRTRASRLDVTRTVRAAGGLVRRRREDGVEEILLVHRPAYDDWSFPKGKLELGESEEDAAIREVEEETGLRCRLERELATTRYRDARGRRRRCATGS